MLRASIRAVIYGAGTRGAVGGGIGDESLDKNFATLCGEGVWTCSANTTITTGQAELLGGGSPQSVTQAGFAFSAGKTYTVTMVFNTTFSYGHVLLGDATTDGDPGHIFVTSADLVTGSGTVTYSGLTGITGTGFVFWNWDPSEPILAQITEFSVVENL